MVEYFDFDKSGTIGVDELHHLLISIHSDKIAEQAFENSDLVIFHPSLLLLFPHSRKLKQITSSKRWMPMETEY